MVRPLPVIAVAALFQASVVGYGAYAIHARMNGNSLSFPFEQLEAVGNMLGASADPEAADLEPADLEPADPEAADPTAVADSVAQPTAQPPVAKPSVAQPSDTQPSDAQPSEPPPQAPSATAEAAPAEAETPADPAAPDRVLIELRRPTMRAAEPPAGYSVLPYPDHVGRVAVSWGFSAPVFSAPSASRRVRGVVRRNTVLAVERFAAGKGCSHAWYELRGGGYVCSGAGFSVRDEATELPARLQSNRPGVESWLPYPYGKIASHAKILYRLPSEAELAGEREMPVQTLATGARFVAAERFIHHAGHDYVRSPRGSYVDIADVRVLPPPTMRGEFIGEQWHLPIAFVHEDFAPLHDPATLEVVGWAEKFARFEVEDAFEQDGLDLVVGKDGFAAPGAAIRVARQIRRPRGIARKAQWIHIDLSSQTLVVYEGDTPILATLISSGKPGYDTPTGIFRIHKKYITTTMAGPDDVAGTFEVDQVPWTMYYFGSFAMHGVYWHDGFGKVRSHGCTNIPPVDARFIFYWSKPALPPGWHAGVGLRGPSLYFTD